MASNRDKLLAQFRELVLERLARVSRSLMAVEAGPDVEAGKLALRELHGLKGEARMMGFADVNSVVHVMEELLRAVEPLGYALTAPSIDALLAASDSVSLLAGATSGEAVEVPKLMEWLGQCVKREKERASPGAPSDVVATPAAPPSAPKPAPQEPEAAAAVRPAPDTKQAAAVRADASIRITQSSLEVLTSTVTGLQQRGRRSDLAASMRRELTRELAALHRDAEHLGPNAGAFAARVGRTKELAGELNRLSSLIATEQQRDLSALAEEIQGLRMLPLGVLFEVYPRMVRDLAKELGRDVELAIEGADERVDRTVLEALRDPLLHLVRNAVDHGLEPRAERERTGKPYKGTLEIAAFREGERLVLQVRDDGRGLDPGVLRQAAVRRGLLTEDVARGLNDAAALDLIFLAGFSSRDTVTDVSGRGVGLDVVRSTLIAVGGEATVESRPGFGALFEVRVPLSLTVAPVLFIQVGEERYCLPAANVVQALTVQASDVVEVAGRTALRIGDTVLPFMPLAASLGLAAERRPQEGELVLVVRGRGQHSALGVDRVLDERVQAIFPLKGVLGRFAHLSGATSLADGSLAMVLSAAHLVSVAQGRGVRLAAPPRVSATQRKRILLADDSPLTRELLVSLLDAVGYDVVQVENGQQALDWLARDRCDCLVTDLEMPVMDGLELTKRVKASPLLQKIPVVVVTTRGSEADRRRGMQAGADGYVTKGDLVRQDLVDVVARLVS